MSFSGTHAFGSSPCFGADLQCAAYANPATPAATPAAATRSLDDLEKAYMSHDRRDHTPRAGLPKIVVTCEKLAPSELETKVNAPSIAPSQALMQGILLGIYFHR